MRQKRAKAYKRLMQTYSLTFGFRQPYQVLGAFAHFSPVLSPALQSHRTTNRH